MSRKKVLKLTIVFVLFSILLSFSSTIFAKREAACYFCNNNQCLSASGSGWSGCVTGNVSCGFYGNSCMSN